MKELYSASWQGCAHQATCVTSRIRQVPAGICKQPRATSGVLARRMQGSEQHRQGGCCCGLQPGASSCHCFTSAPPMLSPERHGYLRAAQQALTVRVQGAPMMASRSVARAAVQQTTANTDVTD